MAPPQLGTGAFMFPFEAFSTSLAPPCFETVQSVFCALFLPSSPPFCSRRFLLACRRSLQPTQPLKSVARSRCLYKWMSSISSILLLLSEELSHSFIVVFFLGKKRGLLFTMLPLWVLLSLFLFCVSMRRRSYALL